MRYFILATGLLMFGTGTWFLITAVSDLRKASISRSWPIVIGKIQAGTVKVRRGKAFTDYFVDVTYTYVVHGVSYSGARAGFVKREKNCGFVPTRREAESRLLHFPTGRSVNVMYSPRTPRISTLETGVDASGLINRLVTLLLGLLFLALPTLVACVVLRSHA